MTRLQNPFTATLGSTPRYMAGREEEIADFRLALFDGPGAHERISLISGPRGVGKTVLLNAFEDVARQNSWWVISETATPGFTQRITDAVVRLIRQHLRGSKQILSGLNIAGVGGIAFAQVEEHQPRVTLRDALTELLLLQAEVDQALGQEPVGILITLDELHYIRREEVADFGVTIQHLVREDREIAVAMAGIPQSIAPLLASGAGSNPVTFLRRANRIELGLIDESDVIDALAQPLREVGIAWDEAALSYAARACGGYPFMVQLVGQESFRQYQRRQVEAENDAGIKGRRIVMEDVNAGVEVARRKLWQLVHEPALADLSQRDRDFLVAMAADEGPSRVGDIADRLGVGSRYVGTYRARLLAAEMIETAGHGQVIFALPYMREYLRERLL